jgi:integrase
MSQWGRKMPPRKSTRYPGVQARESASRRHNGRPDVCYTIDYHDAHGKRTRKDIGWASEGFSAALAAQMRAKLINDAKTSIALGLPVFQSQLTFLEAWELYKIEWMEANKKRTAADAILIRKHLKSLSDLPLSQITVYHLNNIMNCMRENGLSNQSIRLAIGLVSRVMRKMASWGKYSGRFPFDGITLPKLNNVRQRFLTPEEARDLLFDLRKRSPKTWLMALISLHCGLRFGEVANLRWGDIDIGGRKIYISDPKNERARHAVMTNDVAEELVTLVPKHLDALIFPTSEGTALKYAPDSFNRAVDSLGLNDTGETIVLPDKTVLRPKIKDARKRVCFHTLRHTYASWLAMGGQGQLAIADRLGHQSLQMTKRYTHLMDESRRKTADIIGNVFHSDSAGQEADQSSASGDR